MKAKIALAISLTAVQVGCAQAQEGREHRPTRSANPQTLEQVAKPTKAELEMRKRLDAEFDKAESEGCTWKDRFARCKRVRVGFQPAPPKDSSAGQRILVLDAQFLTPALLTRHKSKILDLLVMENGGDYRRSSAAFNLTELQVKLTDIVSSSDAPIRAEALGEVGETIGALSIMAATNDSSESTGTNHGEIVFETLAKYVSKAQFLIAPFPVITPELYCRLGDQAGRDEMRGLYLQALTSLLPRVRDLGITHANISWASTDATVKEKFKAMCGHWPEGREVDGLLDLVVAQTLFVRNLAKKAGLLVVQSAPNTYADYDFDPKWEGTAWSCFKDSSVLSVGYLGFMNSGIPGGGYDIDEKWIPYQQKSSSACTDVFVNGGIHEVRASQGGENYADGYKIWWDENSFVEHYFSFISKPAKELSNSWLTPVALSMAIHLEQEEIRRGGQRPSPAESARKLKGRMFDPLANRQTELHKALNQ